MDKLKKILKSKYIVFIAIISFWGIGSYKTIVNADYSFGAVYQYYLLDNRGGDIVQDAEETKIPVIGSVGSGNVSGSFSYDDMVNSASAENKDKTKQFVSMMATYSTFNYFDNKIQGFEFVVTLLVRVLCSIILLPLALLTDLLNAIVPSLINGLAKLNVITLLGSAIGNLQITSDLAEALNISTDTIKTFINVGFSSAIMLILFAVVGTLRKGSTKIDQRYASKLKGRLISIVLLPMMVTAGAYIISTLNDVVKDGSKTTSDFSNYMIDVRSWAYNFNFAPKGDSSDASDIRPTTKSSYVDLSLNPYTSSGKERIQAINSKSSLAGDKKSPFRNTTIMLSYAGLQTFSSVDFINYKGSPASLNYYGRSDGAGETFGSYYNYANNLGKQLVDVDKSITGTGKSLSKEKADGSYKSAISDYKDGDSMFVTPEVAWRDRFIYGAKNSGEALDKYYNDKPSQEMIITEVGTNGGYALTNQSMFLALSTIFGETGGRYSIEAPARGAMALKGQFDSNRSDYFVISMVGSPLFTIFGMIAEPVIQLLVLLALIMAIISIGLIQMNLIPLTAWVKGVFIGDIEYAQAFIIYSIGIAGTILSMYGLPEIITLLIFAFAKLIVFPSGLVTEINTPQSSLAYEGTPLIITAGVSIILVIMFFKDSRFRILLISVFTLAWDWAVATGKRLENVASRGMGNRIGSARRSNQRRLQNFEGKAGSWFKPIDGKGEPDNPDNPDNPNPPFPESEGTGEDFEPTSVDELQRQTENQQKENNDKVIDNFNQDMIEKQTDDEANPLVKAQAVEVEQALEEVKDEPNDKNIDEAQDKLTTYKDILESEGEATPEELENIDNMQEELERMRMTKDLENINNEVSEKELSEQEKEELEKQNLNSQKTKQENEETMLQEEQLKELLEKENQGLELTEQEMRLKELLEKESQGLELTEQEIREKESIENEMNNKQTTIDELQNSSKEELSKETAELNKETSSVFTSNNISGVEDLIKETVGSKEKDMRVSVSGEGNVKWNTDPISLTGKGQETENITNVRNINDSMSTNEYTANRQNYIHRQTKELSEGLGRAVENRNVAKAVDRVSESKDVEEMKKSLQFMRTTFAVLTEEERKNINQDKVSKTIENMLKYISNNEK